MTESDHDYFRRRAGEERAAAAGAGDPLAGRAHLELAQLYDEVAAAALGQPITQFIASDAAGRG
jgi:NAD(P)H-hydrate repair Nnr-like enzyme with NAD(P)H-hydrate dehydratase domain